MKYGYCRISTPSQSIDRQIRNIITAYPDAKIVEEIYTGTTTARPKWDQLRRKLRRGDTVVFDSVSRMSRNAAEGFALYRELYAQGIELVYLKEPHINTETYKAAIARQTSADIDTGDAAADKMVNAILNAITEYTMHLAEQQIRLAFDQAQKEVDDLRQRTREGMETARQNGKQIGAVEGAKLTTRKSIAAKEIIKKHSKDFSGTLSDVDVMKLCGVARNSYYKYKRELLQDQM